MKVRNVDLLDGTPILDLKPYVPWTDAIPDAETGWLAEEGSLSEDVGRRFEVGFDARAVATLAFLSAEGVELEGALRQSLSLGPSPHAYRRIKPVGDGFVLAMKAFRVHFTVAERVVAVHAIRGGYRASELDRPELALYRRLEAWNDAQDAG